MIKTIFDKLRPNFEEGGKLKAFRSVFEGMETFMLVPNTTSRVGVSVHDAIDSKRIMSFVVIALLPALLFGMYNIGYQNAVAAGKLTETGLWTMFLYGFLLVLPKIIVSYVVGLGIEFTVAQWKHEEIQEGYLVTGILIPLIVPVGCPLWMLALAVAFSVIFCKEIFGGTGMNIFNPALVARAFLFFSYPTSMSGDKVWVAGEQVLGLGYSRLYYHSYSSWPSSCWYVSHRKFERHDSWFHSRLYWRNFGYSYCHWCNYLTIYSDRFMAYYGERIRWWCNSCCTFQYAGLAGQLSSHDALV